MADFERPPRVLVVEDDDEIAQVLQRSLRMEGYEVTHRRRRRQRARPRARLPPRPRRPRPRPAGGWTGSRWPATLRAQTTTCRSWCSPPATRSSRASRASTAAPTTTWSSRSSARSCWRGCGRCCAAARRAGRRRSRVGDLTLNPDTHEVHRGERADRAHPARVRAARVPDAQRAHRRLPPAPARRGLGL